MDNYVGKRLDGRYEIQEIVGVGGMSVVYKAYDNVDDRVVAVKILKDEFLTNDDFVRRFKNESKAIALLSHPNIVKVYDVSFGEKLQYIVMEYVDGITLKEYIQKQGAITWNDALFFTTQILKALQHAHDKGIVHRDIKPQNIILLPNGNIKVADFGIARFSRSETSTDTAIGSVHYISPEQAKGEFTDEKADIYSVGVVLYEMLAGKVPFEAESAVSVALMQLQNNAKRLTEINPDIPLGLEQICIHAMEKDPKDRYQSATEMLLDVEEVINNPKTVFDYSCFVDKSPTKYISNTDKITAETPVINEKPIEKAADSDEDEVEYYDPDHKKKVVSAVLIGIIILVTAAVLLVMAITGSFKTSTNTLDNFVGFSYDELISSNKYDYEFVLEQKKTDEVEPGIVVDQSPEAGSKVISGSQVKLVVSASMDDINVPNIYNLNDEKAKKALANEGLTNYKFTTISSETVEEGLVVYTEPKAGTVVSSDTQIVVFVSSGPTTKEVVNIEVPDVTGLKQEGARAFLEKMGFKNVNFVTQDDLRPKGVVISQSPAAGSSATADDKIKVVISSGETTTTTKPTSKVSLSVSLPKIVDESGEYITDTLEVTIDGETYLNQAVTLNGTNASVSITLDGENEANVKVSLTDIGALETKTVSPKKSMNLKVDFSGFSNEKTTISSNDSQTVQASNVNGAQ
jgi:serine/threonine protein kinase